MTIRFLCQSCGSKLKLPDYAAGRKAQCPECSAVFPVNTPEAAETRLPTATPMRRNPTVEIDEDFEIVSPRPRSKSGRPQQKVVTEAREEEAIVEIDEDPPPKASRPKQLAVTSRPRPKKLKKKRKKGRDRREPVDVPGWIWWTAGVGGAFGLCLIAAIVAVATGHTAELFGYGILLGVMMPVSTIILIISMVVSSQLAGGIDFGEVHTAIAKAFLLLFAVNVIGLVPYGVFFSIPVWLFGLMYLFNLDFWETRFLLFINWVLNYAAKFALAAMVLAALHHAASSDRDIGDHPGVNTPFIERDVGDFDNDD